MHICALLYYSYIFTYYIFIYTSRIGKFLLDWISNPPPYNIATDMSTLCTLLTTPTLILYKTNNIIHIHKIIKLLYDRQCNTILFQDLYTNINTVKMLLEKYSDDYTSQITYDNNNTNNNNSGNNSTSNTNSNSNNNSDNNSDVYNNIIQAMMNIVTFKTDIHMNIHDLYTALIRIMTSIEAVVSASSATSGGSGEGGTGGHNSDPSVDLPSVDPHGNIPNEFFINNEERFRGWCIWALLY